MASFTCVVCFEERSERLCLGRLTTLNGDILRGADCNHPVCEFCMAYFIKSRVEEQLVFGIRCPFEGCKQQVYEQDVHQLVMRGLLSEDLFKRMSELREQDYSERVADLTQTLDMRSLADVQFARRLWSTSRRCPRCNVIIEKKSGCNSFGCICGHRFDFSQAPRGCADGISDFECLVTLAMEHNLSLPVAIAHAKRTVKKHIRERDRVQAEMARRNIPVHLAQLYVEAYLGQYEAIAQLRDARIKRRHNRKMQLLVSSLNILDDEAEQILKRAYAGDEDSQSKIRLARHVKSQDLQSIEVSTLLHRSQEEN